MKWVVDKNFLEDPTLEEYLLADTSNYVVLIDYAGIEGYSGNPLKNTLRSYRILSNFCSRVIVLKNTRKIIDLGPISLDRIDEMVDSESTKNFGEFCQALVLARVGHKGVIRQILAHGAAAQAHLDLMAGAMPEYAEFISHVRKIAGKELLAERRAGSPLSPASVARVIDLMQELSLNLFRTDINRRIPETFRQASDYFIVRYSIAVILWALRWAKDGGTLGAKHEVLRNDVADLSYATLATYFDGLLTNDQKLLDIHHETLAVLKHVFQGAGETSA